ncbi:MAG TPA: hypothetical protein VHB54_08795 [Mucilaginibacter sp.]|nr:hypothetical protein [Mucilaginibacter sp.]
MKNILIFNDFSPETEHAAQLALLLAGKTNTTLHVWNTFSKAKLPATLETISSNTNQIMPDLPFDKNTWIEELESNLYAQTGLTPVVNIIDDEDFTPGNVLSIVNKCNAGLLIKGVAEGEQDISNINRELLCCSTRSGCPVLLIPQRFQCKDFEKIVYPTDLRFCRQDIIHYLNDFATALAASILVAAIASNGLPHLDNGYALNIFKEEIIPSVNHRYFCFDNIREKDILKVFDVLVNGMNNDLLVLVNHGYHFNELLGYDIPYVIPGNIHIPLLIFPS